MSYSKEQWMELEREEAEEEDRKAEIYNEKQPGKKSMLTIKSKSHNIKYKSEKKHLTSLDSLTLKQKKIFNTYIDEINSFIELNKSFRMEIAQYVVKIKEEMFSKGFEISGYEEIFVILNVAKRIDFTHGCIKNWVKVYLSVRDNDEVSSTAEYQSLSISEKLQVANDIKRNKRKASEAVKEHYANKNDPIKKKVFYLERYIGHSLATSRGLETLARELDISDKQKVILKGLI